MTYQTNQPARKTPEQDPFQARSTAHEILFGRTGVLSRARAIKEVSVRMVKNEIRASNVYPAYEAMTPPHEAPASVTVTPEIQHPAPTLINESQKERRLRQHRERVEDAYDEGLSADSFMKYEDLAA